LDNFLSSNLSKEDALTAHEQLASFLDRKGAFNLNSAWELAARGRMVGVDWWEGHFAESAAILCQLPVAVRAMSVPCSSASVERLFSCFGRIHSDSRNRVTHERVQKLG
jgi:hypothetical protein